ncbi:MAG TPA: ThiF family adenylyltransferase [Hanamia sp.]
MLNILASHNNDIKRLIDKGFAVGLDSNFLVVRDIPYLDHEKKLRWGAIVSKLIFVDDTHVKLEDHQIFFCGTQPYQMDCTPIANLGGGPTTLALASSDLVVERSFSNKPQGGFSDLYEKIESYLTIIAGPAMSLYGANPYTFHTSEDVSTSVFKVRDTLTSRAEIGDLSQSFKDEVIAIIGLGGTGAYLLDFLVKTPVKEIRGFDGDYYHAHTAFRSPGKLEVEGDTRELGKKKADVYQKRYEGFRQGIYMHDKFILTDSDEDLQGVTFAFICIDKGQSRKEIIELLIQLQIPFIDVGIGLERQSGSLSGIVRTTYSPVADAENVLEKKWVPTNDLSNEVYKNNIQISELNALNACFAVIRYKQIRAFYADDAHFKNMLFTLDNFRSTYE